MASSYPGSIDSFGTGHADNVREAIHASTINDLADAVNKIETELGVNPSGASIDVATAIAGGGGTQNLIFTWDGTTYQPSASLASSLPKEFRGPTDPSTVGGVSLNTYDTWVATF